MRLLIADDHALILDMLQNYLEQEEDMEIVAATDMEDAISVVSGQSGFDLALLDYDMPGMDGLDELRRFMDHPTAPPVVILSGHAVREVAERAIHIGARGFLPKSMPAQSLLRAIRFMALGEKFVPVDFLFASDHAESPAATGGLSAKSLTARELEVLKALCDGKTNKEIARNLGLREPTIKLHIKTLYRRLGASNRTQAAMIARSWGVC